MSRDHFDLEKELEVLLSVSASQAGGSVMKVCGIFVPPPFVAVNEMSIQHGLQKYAW